MNVNSWIILVWDLGRRECCLSLHPPVTILSFMRNVLSKRLVNGFEGVENGQSVGRGGFDDFWPWIFLGIASGLWVSGKGRLRAIAMWEWMIIMDQKQMYLGVRRVI